jgi:hypothetical protein
VVRTLPRFPKTRLWQRAAALEETLLFWIDELKGQIDEAEDLGLGRVTWKLNERREVLELAKEKVAEASEQLFSLP